MKLISKQSPAITRPTPKAFQKKYADIVSNKFLTDPNHHAEAITAQTGYGKTFIVAEIIDTLLKAGFFKPEKHGFTAIKILYVTKANVVEQTARVLKDYGFSVSSEHIGYDIFVTNYDQLRASLGELIIRDYTEIVHGEPVIKYEWKENMTPILVVWDEGHSLMNADKSQQGKIAVALNDLPEDRAKNVYQIFTSATLVGRVSEAKCLAVATRTTFKYGFVSSPLTNAHWLDFASDVAYPSDYKEFNQAACERLKDRLSPYWTTVKGVRPKFHARNSAELIDFDTPLERQVYNIAFEEYQEKLREAGKNELEGLAAMWVAMQKFAQAAELIKRRQFAKRLYEIVSGKGKAAILGVKFRSTIAAVTEILCNDYNVPRGEISLIWGGISDIKELKEDYQGLDLGTQNRKQRQREIDKYQAGDSLYCFFTLKAGGAGLSLHHATANLRPRESILTPTYNAKEAVQALGRGPRLTSMSDTIQRMLFYRGTIEEETYGVMGAKMMCLKSINGTTESWYNILTKVKTPESIEDLEQEADGYIEEEEGEEVEI